MADPRFVCIAAVASIAALAACARPTPYQPAENGDGYAEQQLEDDRYRVTFAGNSATPRERVENGLLLRAAEITRDRGYDYFVVVNRDVERSVRYHTTYSGLGGHGFHHVHGFRHHPSGFGGFTSGTTHPRNSYRAFANVVLRTGTRPADDANAYNARDIIEHLRPVVATTTSN